MLSDHISANVLYLFIIIMCGCSLQNGDNILKHQNLKVPLCFALTNSNIQNEDHYFHKNNLGYLYMNVKTILSMTTVRGLILRDMLK